MPVRIQTALLFLIAVPLAMLGWIGAVWIREQELAAQKQVVGLAEERLKEWTRTVDAEMSNLHRSVLQQLEDAGKRPDRLYQLDHKQPNIRRTMWVSARGQLLYPEPPTSNANNEILIFNELTMMARQRPPVPKAIRDALAASVQEVSLPTRRGGTPTIVEKPSQAAKPYEVTEQESSKSESRWHEWYFDEGLQLVIWSVQSDGSAVGCWLERARWMSNLIAVLPDAETASSEGATALVDANGNVVYRWGAMDISLDNPLTEVSLREPLASWKLKYYLPATPSSGASHWWNYWPWMAGISTIAIAVLALGGYVSLATAKQLRAANQRVSFAGQVSHELRTPLTNIRLYAEMAKRDLSQPTPAIDRIGERLDVIDSESKRLGRLISGVLEFIQGRNKSQPVTWRYVVPDDVIRQVVTQFDLSLERNAIDVQLDLHASQAVELDSDILEQILVNLISNVEKYAASGKSMTIGSWLDGDRLYVAIQDRGPGIASRFAKQIFKPFFRLDDGITAPSGTGLGLTIARAAAQRHGGGLELMPCDTGTRFQIWLHVRRAGRDDMQFSPTDLHREHGEVS